MSRLNAEDKGKPRRLRRPFMERILPLFTDNALALTALLLALVFAVVLIATATAEEAPSTKYVLVDTGSWLNIRERPEAHATVVIRMERGEALQVYAISADGWAEVARAGDSGYCRVEFLCDALPDTPAPYTAAADKLRVRALPNAKADTVQKLRKGKQVEVLAFLTCEDTRWARVHGGFIMADYLSAEDT
jgi:uncharacterized protein YgiM (DUF1202 family)